MVGAAGVLDGNVDFAFGRFEGNFRGLENERIFFRIDRRAGELHFELRRRFLEIDRPHEPRKLIVEIAVSRKGYRFFATGHPLQIGAVFIDELVGFAPRFLVGVADTVAARERKFQELRVVHSPKVRMHLLMNGKPHRHMKDLV